MKDFELYQQILGLVEPWRVESVTLKPQEREIEVRVGFADTLWGCPQCCVNSGCRFTITKSDGGGIWTVASSRRSSCRGCPA